MIGRGADPREDFVTWKYVADVFLSKAGMVTFSMITHGQSRSLPERRFGFIRARVYQGSVFRVLDGFMRQDFIYGAVVTQTAAPFGLLPLRQHHTNTIDVS